MKVYKKREVKETRVYSKRQKIKFIPSHELLNHIPSIQAFPTEHQRTLKPVSRSLSASEATRKWKAFLGGAAAPFLAAVADAAARTAAANLSALNLASYLCFGVTSARVSGH
jgi:2-polyprenyl-3-methyl-5-hydroxy-6-metoxy-1,4-benzoquinol methylase